MPNPPNLPEEAVENLARWLYEKIWRSPLVGARSWSQLRRGRQNALRSEARIALDDVAPAIRAAAEKRAVEEERERLKRAVKDNCAPLGFPLFIETKLLAAIDSDD